MRPVFAASAWQAAALGVVWLAFAWPSDLPAQSRPEPMPGDYRVENGRVDPGTFVGWRVFHTACYGCHGVDARGTDLAPNLVERVKTLTPRAFATKVLTSYRVVEPGAGDRNQALEALIDQVMRQERDRAGQLSMPAWDDNPRVRPHVLDLFAYLSARADGKLGPGRPRVLQRP